MIDGLTEHGGAKQGGKRVSNQAQEGTEGRLGHFFLEESASDLSETAGSGWG